MSESPHPLERLLQQAARKVSGGDLHPLEVLSRVQEAVRGAVRDGCAPNDILVEMNPDDFKAWRPGLRQLSAELARLLDQFELESQLQRTGERRLRFAAGEGVAEASVRVHARFAGERPGPLTTPPGATRRLMRQRGVALVLGDGTRVAVSHTPFTIGRGPGNDLVIPSLAVSRQHAEIALTADGYIVRDLGSRNGILVNGVPREWVLLAPGVTARIGDVDIRLEKV